MIGWGRNSAAVRPGRQARASTTAARLGVLGLCLATIAPFASSAATFQEDFSSDPIARGWGITGNADLFHWNATNQTLEVTWDSAQANSYFYWLLGPTLASSDDFAFAFDLVLADVAVGVNPQKSFTFEIAAGLLNLQSALNSDWQRGSGVNASHGPRNLVEFDYFPDSGYGATVSPTMVSSNNQFAVGFDFPLEMDAGARFHIALSYTAGNKTLSTAMTRNGQPFGPIQDVVLSADFTDFRLDHFAISSYSDAGADGSLLAHGVVDNITITTPPPPILNMAGQFTNLSWQVQFLSRTNWRYTLERTIDFQSWTDLLPALDGTGSNLYFLDTTPPPAKAFYRVRAERP
jgi:hypothetical protein